MVGCLAEAGYGSGVGVLGPAVLVFGWVLCSVDFDIGGTIRLKPKSSPAPCEQQPAALFREQIHSDLLPAYASEKLMAG